MSEFGTKKRFRLQIADAGEVAPRERTIVPEVYLGGGDPSRVDDPAYVFLGGSALPLRAFRLDLPVNVENWRLTAFVPGMLEVDGITLEQGDVVPLESGQRIKLRDASLTPLVPNAAMSLRTGSASLKEVQLSVLNDVLEFEERQNNILNLGDSERREVLHKHINALIDGHIPNINRTALHRLSSEALLTHLELFCLATDDAGTPPPISAYTEMSKSERFELSKVTHSLVVQLALSSEPDATAEDLEKVRKHFWTAMERDRVQVSAELQRALFRDAVLDWVMRQRFDMGALEYLLEAPIISEVMICGYNRIFVEKVGKVFDTGLQFESEEEIAIIAKRVVGNDNGALTLTDPLADARMPDGSRVNAVLQPTALLGTAITIRKFSPNVLTLKTLQSDKLMMSYAMERFLRAAVSSRRNIIVSGGTGTGKTTLLNALAITIPYGERIVTIEDTGELKIAHARDNPDDTNKSRNIVALEARAENFGKPITIRDLVRNALRMRPDRVIVGECRDGATLDMLQAMNTGHDGSMTTAHANSPEELLLRLENLALQGAANLPARVVRQQIASAVDLIVQVHRTASIDPEARAKGRKQRSIVQIAEVGDFEEETGTIPVFPIYEMADPEGSPRYIVSGYLPSFFEDLQERSQFDVKDFFLEAAPCR